MIAGILLAAGAGVRFGGGKLLHPLSDGTPLGLAALRNLRAALADVVVVLRPSDTDLYRLFAEQHGDIVQCADAHLGMGHSLAAGVARVMSAQGWIVALADMPHLQPATIRTIADELTRRGGIVVPMYREQRGHPVGFSRDYREELLGLTGDTGARSLLKRHAAAVHRLQVDDPGVLQDIDTREDAERLLDPTRGASR